MDDLTRKLPLTLTLHSPSHRDAKSKQFEAQSQNLNVALHDNW